MDCGGGYGTVESQIIEPCAMPLKLPPHKPKMGIVSLNWPQIMGQILTECARKIEQIGRHFCDCLHER